MLAPFDLTLIRQPYLFALENLSTQQLSSIMQHGLHKQ